MSNSDSDEDAAGGQDQDWDWDDEGASAATRDVLYHEKEHESTAACLSHCASNYGWDLVELAKALKLDIYGSIRVVTWLRREVASKRQDLEDEALIQHLRAPFDERARPAFLEDDEYLFPYLPDDPLLPALAQELGDGDDDDEQAGASVRGEGGGGGGGSEMAALRAENERLREELQQQQELIAAAKASVLGVDDDEGDGIKDGKRDKAERRDDKNDDDDGGRGGEDGGAAMKKSERSYFDSYSKIAIHQEMLSDRTRTGGYRDFLCNNPSLIKDKVVLDVGCGTGILCLFAARAGAKLVIGIDMSDIIEDAREIVRANGFEDKITLIRGKVEDVTLPVEQVDVVVSEWMGYFLLYESMMDSVVFARDKYLRPGGVCMPDKMEMFIAAIDDGPRLDFWDDVYGFDMSVMRRKVRERSLIDPMVEHYQGKQLLSAPALLKSLDCHTITVKDLEFSAPFRVVAWRDSQCDALLSWFDTHFRGGCDQPVSFTTGPVPNLDDQTHWKQTAFYLEDGVSLKTGDAIEGVIHCHRAHRNPRHLDIVIEWAHVPGDGRPRGPTKHQTYELA